MHMDGAYPGGAVQSVGARGDGTGAPDGEAVNEAVQAI